MDMPIPNSQGEQVVILQVKENECLNRNETAKVSGGCPQVWDRILCWPNTPSDTLATLPCPAYFAGFTTEGNATKLCSSNGTWYFQEGHYWTNYSGCFELETSSRSNSNLFEKYIPILKVISQVGYGVSLITLVFAFILLASFKRLRCPRNVLHMHLFVSFIMRASLTLLKDSIFVSGIGLSHDIEAIYEGNMNSSKSNSWICKCITSFWQYFIMANYSWILMEGLYLHNLIFLALFSDTSSITIYVLLGWGLPLLVVVPWVIVRALFENTLCWTINENSYYFSIIRVPIALSILLNFGLFLNIVRVLLLKLTASISEERRRYRRWAKSTLVLVPLFGVHYALFFGMSYSINKNEYVELVWLFCDQLFASFQGFFVAVLYCFMNGEVRSELAKLSWNRRSPQYFRNQYSITERPISRFFRPAKRQKRGSTAESCMTSFMSSVPTDLNNRRPTLQKNLINSHFVSEIKADSCMLNKGANTVCSGVPEIN